MDRQSDHVLVGRAGFPPILPTMQVAGNRERLQSQAPPLHANHQATTYEQNWASKNLQSSEGQQEGKEKMLTFLRFAPSKNLTSAAGIKLWKTVREMVGSEFGEIISLSPKFPAP